MARSPRYTLDIVHFLSSFLKVTIYDSSVYQVSMGGEIAYHQMNHRLLVICPDILKPSFHDQRCYI